MFNTVQGGLYFRCRVFKTPQGCNRLNIVIPLKQRGDFMDKGFFGSLFDLNGEGKLDLFERALDYKAFEELVLNDNENNESEDEN